MKRMRLWRIRVRIGLVIVVLLPTFFLPPSAAACFCGARVSPEEEFMRMDAVIEGTVVSIRNSSRFEHRLYELFVQPLTGYVPLLHGLQPLTNNRQVEIEVHRSWKGVASERMTLHTGIGGGDCGYGFVADKRYVLYLYTRTDGELTTDICGLTNSATLAVDDLAYLRTRPTLELLPAPLLSVGQWVGVTLLGGMVLMLVGGGIGIRRYIRENG